MSKVNRLLKKTHLLRCAQSPRSNVSVNTTPLVDFSRASHLDLFEQPGIIVFQQALKIRPHILIALKPDPVACGIDFGAIAAQAGGRGSSPIPRRPTGRLMMPTLVRTSNH